MKVKPFIRQIEKQADKLPKTEREFVIEYVLIRATHVEGLSAEAAACTARKAWLEIEKCKE